MRPLCFPKMFNTNNTRVWRADQHKLATKQNCEVLLRCERGELQCDPYFGITLSQYLYDQNSTILKDVLIDIIYTQLAIFLPQLKVDRANIEIIQDRELGKLYCYFVAVDQIDFTTDTYELLMFKTEDNS